MTTLCANCQQDLNMHTETQTDKCLKMVSLQFPSFVKEIDKLRGIQEQLVSQIMIQEKLLNAAQKSLENHNCYEKVFDQ